MIGFLLFLAGPPGWIAYALIRSRRRRGVCYPAVAVSPERNHSGDSRAAFVIVIIIVGVIGMLAMASQSGVGEPRYIDGIPVPTSRPTN